MSRLADPSLVGRAGLAVPWLAYVAVTVVGPALNGAWRRPDFAEHALLTAGVSGVLLLAWWAIARQRRRRLPRISPRPRPGSAAP